MTSLYAYGLPVTTNEFRDRTANHSTYAGVMSPSFRCVKCGENKRVAGRKKCDKGYACADCQQAPSMFSTLLFGDSIKLPKGKARIVTFKTKADRENNSGEQERLKNLEKVRKAIRAGNHTIKSISIQTDLSGMTVRRRLEELIDMKEVELVGKKYVLREKKCA